MRNFDHNATWEDVQDMTVEEAITILSHDANSDGKTWSARPHKVKAAQMAIDALTRIQSETKIQLANSLIGRQLWMTHWWNGKYWRELQQPKARKIQYISIHKDGRFLLNFKDGAVLLNAYGNMLFNTKEQAESELAYLRRRDNL